MEKREKLEEIYIKTIDISPHSQVIIKLINLLKNEHTSIEEIEEYLAKDKGLTAKFLRIANSPYYGMSRKIKTVKDALFLIGLESAKSLIFATSVIYLYKNFGEFEKRLWEHSLGVGLFSSLLATALGHISPELFLASGILHDIGKIFLYNANSEIYQNIHEYILKSERETIDIENEKIGVNHAEMGAFVAEKWNYPEEIKKVIEYHHTFPFPHRKERIYAEICNTIRISDQICLDLGLGFKREIPPKIDYGDLKIDENLLKNLSKIFIHQFNHEKKFLLNLS